MKRTGATVCLGMVLLASPLAADTLQITVDKGRHLRLDQDAGIVLVAEPNIANVVIESPRMIFILGKRPGETNLFVMGRDGKAILQADIVVVPNDPRQVTVHRSSTESTLSCAPRCAGVRTPGPASQARSGGAAPGAAPPIARSTDRQPASEPVRTGEPTAAIQPAPRLAGDED
jgi:Flp pilus assembly secretin CpaC